MKIKNIGKHECFGKNQRISYSYDYDSGRVIQTPHVIIEEFTFPLETNLFEISEKIKNWFAECDMSRPIEVKIKFHGNTQNEGEILYYIDSGVYCPEYRVAVFRDGDKIVAELY